MKHCFLLLALFLATLSAMAQQTEKLLLGHSVRYVNHHMLLRDGENFNVIDTQIEWPEVIDRTQLAPLQETICNWLWDAASTNVDSLYGAFLADKGKQVTSELPILPDDSRFCYFKTTISVRDYEPQRWISCDVSMEVDPQSQSPFAPKKLSRVVTYDLAKERVMTARSIVDLALMLEPDYSSYLIDRLLQPLSDDDFSQLKAIKINDAWPEDGGTFLGLRVECVLPDKLVSYDRSLPTEVLRPYLTAAGRRLLGKKPVTKKDLSFFTLPLTWQGDTIYNKVEQMPQPEGGAKRFADLLTGNIEVDGQSQGRLMLSFLVDTDGRPKDIRVVDPVSPEVDRSAATAVRVLPNYTPGQHNGKAVPVRVNLPIHITKQ